MLKFLWKCLCFAFLYWVTDTTEVTTADGIIYLLLMVYLVKDEVMKAWNEIMYEEE